MMQRLVFRAMGHRHSWTPTGRLDWAAMVREVSCESWWCPARTWQPVKQEELA